VEIVIWQTLPGEPTVHEPNEALKYMQCMPQ